MGIRGWILVAIGMAAGPATWAADCVPQREMQEIAQHFTQFSHLAKSDYCFNDSHESHLIQGLMFMRKTQFSARMPKSTDDLFSGHFATDWYRYFIGRINDFNIPSNCPKGVGAYVYMFGNTMYVCPMLLSDNFTALDRASVMMHEARHIDGYPHITCSRGPRRGMQGACDSRISDHGSYGVTVETYAQLARYAEDLHPALRAYSRAAAVGYADEAFENSVKIDREPRLMLLTSQREFHLLSLTGGVRTEALGESPALGYIVMRGQHMILVPDDKSRPAKYVFARNEGGIAQEAGDIAVEYNALSAAERTDWVGIHIGAQWSARVLRNKVRIGCDPRSEATTERAIPAGEVAEGLIYPNGYDRGVMTAHVLMRSSKIYEIGCNGSGRPIFREVWMAFDQKYKKIYQVGSHVVGLTPDGRLFKLEGGKSTALQTALDGRIHDIAPNQWVEFFDVN